MPTYKSRSGEFCDYCVMQYGWIKDASGISVPNPKGRRQAYITTISETHTGKEPVKRSYCYPHIQELSKWSDGSVWTLEEQIQYAKDNRHQLKIGF